MQPQQYNKYHEYLFVDAAIAGKIQRDGFALVDLPNKNVLNEAVVDAKRLLKTIPFKERAIKFTSVGRIENGMTRLDSTNSINKYIIPHLKSYFHPGKVEFISGVHLIKPPSPLSNLNPHQDSSLVDERIYPSVYAWVPLTNVNAHNGTLYVLPNSHKAGLLQRSLNIPWEFLPYLDVLKKYMLPVNVKLGQVVFFDSALIHSSSRNITLSTRLAVNVFIKPIEAKYLHFYSDKELKYEQTEVYNVTPDFYYKDNIMERPGKPFEYLRTEAVGKLALNKEKVDSLCREWTNEYYLNTK